MGGKITKKTGNLDKIGQFFEFKLDKIGFFYFCIGQYFCSVKKGEY